MDTNGGGDVVAKDHPGWVPGTLRKHREAHGLTLEGSGEELRKIAEIARLPIQANFQTVFNHEAGKAYPNPHYQRAYCLLYNAAPWELQFRSKLPHEEQSQVPKITPHTDSVTGAHVQAVESALLQIAPGERSTTTVCGTGSWMPGAGATRAATRTALIWCWSAATREAGRASSRSSSRI